MTTHDWKRPRRTAAAVEALALLFVAAFSAAGTAHAEVAGIFAPPIGPFADGGRYTATADINQDGRPDLVGVRNATDEVSILLGAGDGTFPTEFRFPVGDQPIGAGIGDFDENGFWDVAVASRNALSVLLGNGDGSLQPEIRLELFTRFSRSDVAVDDLDDDGHEDIVITGDPPAGVQVFLGAGDGTFAAPSHYPTFPTRLRTVLTGDLDGDQVPDLVVGNENCCGYVSVLLGVGDGSFDPDEVFDVAAIPISIALTDLDADGELDVVASGWGTNAPHGVSILPGQGDGTFGPEILTIRSRDSFAVAAADFDRDGRVDVAVGESSLVTSWHGVSIFLGAGDGTIAFEEEYETGRRHDHILVGDFNGDGLPDLVASESGAFTFLNQRSIRPGFVDDSDRDDACFGVDDPPVCDATDIALVETRVTLCDFTCAGDADLCCGPGSDGEEALVVHMDVIGNPSPPRLDQGEFTVFLDFGEADDQDGDGMPDLSLKDAFDEPGVAPVETWDIRVHANLGQSSSRNRGGRFGVERHFTANAGLNPRIQELSRINQVEGTVDFVLPLAEVFAAADEAQRVAAGIAEEAETVELLLWWASRCEGNVRDQAPNTDDQGPPSVRSEASLFPVPLRQLELFAPDGSAYAVDFRGSDQCAGGDGDAVVVGETSEPQFVTISNPSLIPLTVTDLAFSDPRFSTTASFPVLVPAVGGDVSVPILFQPLVPVQVTATVSAVGDDPTPPMLSLIGRGLPDEPPVLMPCVVSSEAIVLGEPFDIEVQASDSASLSNIVSCNATAFLVGTGTTVGFSLVDDGSDGNSACDGLYAGSDRTGAPLGPGRWVFNTECVDRQGRVGRGTACDLIVDQDADGDGIPDGRDPCPLDPLNDADGDGLCAEADNCPMVANNGAPSNGLAGGTADVCRDPGAPDCLRVDFLGIPDVLMCVDSSGGNDLTECTSDADCTVTPGFDTCSLVPFVACVDRGISALFSFCRLGPAAFDAFGVGFPNYEIDNADCHANEPPGCVSIATNQLVSQGCAPGDSCGTDIQADSDGDGIGDACEP